MWVFYAPIKSTGWSYATALPEKDILAFLKLQLTRGVIGIVILLILIIISIFIVSTQITRPLSYLAGLVKQVGEGDFKLSVNGIKSNDEIGDLAGAFTTMIEDLNLHVEERARETAQRKAVERELEIAREIQAALLPDNFPQGADQIKYDLYAVNAAAGHIGGDFYDFFNIDKGRFVFIIADVSGKGTPAAIIMAITKTLIRELARDYDSPAMILKQVNRLLIEMHAQPVFVTMFIGIYEPDTGHILYANAGHLLPYVLEADGNTRKFGETTGTIVGMIEDMDYEENREQLKVGEYLVAYTDGVTEARSSAGDFYGESHLVRFLSNCKELRTAEICELLIDDVSAFQSQHLADDVTILILNRCQ